MRDLSIGHTIRLVAASNEICYTSASLATNARVVILDRLPQKAHKARERESRRRDRVGKTILSHVVSSDNFVCISL